MTNISNFRVAVEMIIKHGDKILLTKNADEAKMKKFEKPHWSVPAGKVELTEKAIEAAVREAKEETDLDIKILSQLDCRTVTIIKRNKEQYRLMYTYLVEPTNPNQKITLNEEHSDYIWITEQDLEQQDRNISKHLKPLLQKAFQ